jgi:hypothetical protein
LQKKVHKYTNYTGLGTNEDLPVSRKAEFLSAKVILIIRITNNNKHKYIGDCRTHRKHTGYGVFGVIVNLLTQSNANEAFRYFARW